MLVSLRDAITTKTTTVLEKVEISISNPQLVQTDGDDRFKGLNKELSRCDRKQGNTKPASNRKIRGSN